jgi:hypothetical protein
MNAAHRNTLREVMETAWSLYRAELRGPNPRTFSDALAGAWRWVKAAAARMAARPTWASGSASRTLYMADTTRSPIRRSLTGQVYAYTRARTAGRLTSRLGA